MEAALAATTVVLFEPSMGTGGVHSGQSSNAGVVHVSNCGYMCSSDQLELPQVLA